MIGMVLGCLGLICMMTKRTLLGVLIGVQLLFLGATTILVLAGVGSNETESGQIYGLFILMVGLAQLVVGYSLAVRLFYLKKRIGMETIRSLRH